MNGPKISVLITTFNHERWIETCLDSVLSQGDVNLEIIVHDDNSSDLTCRKLELFANDCKIIRNETGVNIGISESFNKLLRMATGEYIAVMSGDDAWHESKLSTQVRFMEENKAVDICFTDSLTLDAEDNIGPRFPVFLADDLDRKQWVHRLFFGNCLPAMSALLRNGGWVQRNRMDVVLRQLQDWDYWVRAACDGINFHMIDEPLTFYRVVGGSVSMDASPQKNSRHNYETIRCLKSYKRLHLAELREVFGSYVEDHDLFVKDRSVEVGLAILLSKVDNRAYKLAAADILSDYFASGASALTDHQYHDFIGELNL